MTVASTTRKAGPFSGNGTQTAFPFSFKIYTKNDIAVTLTTSAGISSTLVLDSDYSVSVNANQDTSPGGTVTYPISGTALSTGSTLTISGNLAYSQTTQLPSGGAYNAQNVEAALDRLTILSQQLLEATGRSLALPVSVASGVSGTLPVPAASKFIGWNETATALQNVDPTTLATIVAFGTANADVFTGTGSQTVFTLSANPGAQANLDVSVGGVTQLPGVDYVWSGGTTVTFTTAPPLNAKVLIRYFQGLPQGTTDSAASTYTQGGTGSVTRSVQTKLRETVSVKDFGAVGDGVTDDTAAIQAALNTGQAVFFPQGYYKANNLTQSTNFQRIFATGDVRVIKNANGPLLTCSGLDVEISGIAFRGDAASPTYTGDGLVMTGNNPRLINCGSRWMSGRAVKCTGQHVQIRGTCDLYQTSDATATGYDIEIGVSGTATLYHHISNIYTSQATGGILTTDCGSLVVEASQFGKLTVAAGTTPAGCNGGHYIGNRINGAVSVNISSSRFAGCMVSSVAVTFAAGTSGHSFSDSNSVDVGGTITDLSSNSLVADLKIVPVANYTPTWTAASVNPSLGNGTIFGTVAKWGKRVDVTIELNIGSTTTLGTGSWYFSMPYAAATNIQYAGSAIAVCAGLFYVGTVLTMQDGTARLAVIGNAAGNLFDSGRPGAWVNGNYLKLTVSYYTA